MSRGLIEISRLSDLRARLRQWRDAGETLALVPTMGNLHAGHLDLVRRGVGMADRCVVSLFVNPMQFGAGEDLGSYPRTYAADRQRLQEVGAHLLFAPPVEEVYTRERDARTRVEVPGISDILCGASRPGHFVGVSTIVCMLFNMIQPDYAIFGEKDFQQLMVIRRMVEDLHLPVEVIGAPTVREPDGLAMSSRNGYLSLEERSRANRLYATLQKVSDWLESTSSEYADLEGRAVAELQRAGMRPDYVSIRRAADLAVPQAGETELVILAAAWLGKARLIDNLRVNRKKLD